MFSRLFQHVTLLLSPFPFLSLSLLSLFLSPSTPALFLWSPQFACVRIWSRRGNTSGESKTRWSLWDGMKLCASYHYRPSLVLPDSDSGSCCPALCTGRSTGCYWATLLCEQQCIHNPLFLFPVRFIVYGAVTTNKLTSLST